ncbi:conserved hypothetical protein [Vibrio chagasii]|nr:conserved hypothetical protein [Vibrio chagasii]CAH7017413.1 conserved hypothetical protein [Vibrio chagasii]
MSTLELDSALLLPIVNANVCPLIPTNDEKTEKLAIILSVGSLI